MEEKNEMTENIVLGEVETEVEDGIIEQVLSPKAIHDAMTSARVLDALRITGHRLMNGPVESKIGGKPDANVIIANFIRKTMIQRPFIGKVLKNETTHTTFKNLLAVSDGLRRGGYVTNTENIVQAGLIASTEAFKAQQEIDSKTINDMHATTGVSVSVLYRILRNNMFSVHLSTLINISKYMREKGLWRPNQS